MIAIATARGFPVHHPIAPIGYPPGQSVPAGCRQELLAHARLAPPATPPPDARPVRDGRRTAATPEQRVAAGIHTSVFGNSGGREVPRAGLDGRRRNRAVDTSGDHSVARDDSEIQRSGTGASALMDDC